MSDEQVRTILKEKGELSWADGQYRLKAKKVEGFGWDRINDSGREESRVQPDGPDSVDSGRPGEGHSVAVR